MTRHQRRQVEQRYLARVIRAAREKRGLGISRLAERAGVSRQTVWRIENGESTTLDTLTKLARVLKLDLVMRRKP